MADLRPLFHYVPIALRPETERDFKWVSWITQLDPHQFAAVSFVGSSDAFKQQRRRGIAVGMHHLDRRFINVTVAGLGIGFIDPLGLAVGAGNADGGLIQASIVAHLKVEREAGRLEAERLVQWRSFRRAAFHNVGGE